VTIEAFDNELPAPGEPLKQKTHEENQRLLDSEVARRVELARSKLTRRQLNQLTKKYSQVHRELNRARYNEMVTLWAEMLTQYNQLRALYSEKPSPKLRDEILDLKREGQRISAKLKKLQPLLDKFEQIRQRLETHQQVLQIEREEKENREAFFRESKVWEEQIKAVFRQSPRLHHTTKDSRGKEVTKIPQIEQVILTPDKVYFRIKTSYQGWLDKYVSKWHFALPYGVDVADLVSDETIANLSAACRRVVTIERSETSQALFYVVHRMDSADGIPKSVRLAQVTDFYPKERHRSTPWAAGIGPDRKVVHMDFEQFPHVLVAGESGGGKSNLINAMISQFITMNSPDELRLVLIDNKGGIELSHFDGAPHLLTPPVISIEGVVPSLKMVRQIMTQRLAMFQKAGHRNLASYNKSVKNPLPRLICVVDEMATLIGVEETPDIHRELRILTSQGRAVGIHMIVCTQHPSVDVLPGWIKTNLTLRIASKMPNHTASQIVVDSISAAHLPEVPGRMVFRRGGSEQVLQTPLCDDNAIAHAVKIAKEYPAAEWQLNSNDPDEAIEIQDPKPVFGRDEYLRAALENGGSLSPRKIYDQVAKDYLSQKEALKLGDEILEQLLQDARVSIDGVWYIVEKVKKGHYLKQDEQFLGSLLEESEEICESESEKSRNEDEISENESP
jgi:hypothetical protein